MALEVEIRAPAPIPLDVSFRAGNGEILALVGPSGAGKSTVLRVIAGLARTGSGRVVVGGETWFDPDAGIFLPPHRRRAGFVFQSYALFPHMSAAENVMAAMDLPSKRLRRDEARRLLDLVHLDGLGDRKPAELSGGQRQRVAVARALARRPRVLLLDEPFSAVDPGTRESLHREIAGLRRALDMPVVLVTHDMDDARLLADRMVVIDKGRSVAAGTTAEVLFDPAALRTLGLREAGAAISARIAAQESDGLTRLDTAAGPVFVPHVEGAIGSNVRLQIAAHEVILSRERPGMISALNVLPATVTDIREGEGPGVLVRLRIGEEAIVARITRRSCAKLAIAPGVSCHAIVKAMAVARDQIGPAA